jgi:hypothetical protein
MIGTDAKVVDGARYVAPAGEFNQIFHAPFSSFTMTSPPGGAR